MDRRCLMGSALFGLLASSSRLISRRRHAPSILRRISADAVDAVTC